MWWRIGDSESSVCTGGDLKQQGTAAFLTSGNLPGRLSARTKAIQRYPGRAGAAGVYSEMIELYQDGKFPFDRLEKFYQFRDLSGHCRFRRHHN
jgi:hypothetical protein